MPLQNRVQPSGNIIATAARGAWLGNRGVLHNEAKNIVRPFQLKAWITCALHFRGRNREVMMPNRWTELFFLDEATAFAAGHRPCFQCRYADHQRFKAAWLKGNPEYRFDEKTSIRQIDEVLHRERINMGKKVTFQAPLHHLPSGTFIQVNNNPILLHNKGFYGWTPFGYESAKLSLTAVAGAEILTPKSIVNTFRAGYYPQMAVVS